METKLWRPCSAAVLAWLGELSSTNPQVGTGKLLFKMLVHIKYGFLEDPSKPLLHFKEGLFILLVISALLKQRSFLQVWSSLERTFYTFPPCWADKEIPALVDCHFKRCFLCCSEEKNKHFILERDVFTEYMDLMEVNETNVFVPLADSSWKLQLYLLSCDDTKPV